jgi:hypothetical protein
MAFVLRYADRWKTGRGSSKIAQLGTQRRPATGGVFLFDNSRLASGIPLIFAEFRINIPLKG